MKVIVRLLLFAALCLPATPALAWPTYFGYFGSHYIGNPVVGCGPTDYANHTNTLWMIASTPQEARLHAQLAASCNKKVVINVDPMFFARGTVIIEFQTQQPNCVCHFLYEKSPGSAAIAASLAAELAGLTQHVAAIFTVDEPYQLTTPHPYSRAQTTTAIKNVHQALHGVLPAVPVAVNFSTYELLPGNERQAPDDVLDATDWLGFDCYLDQGTFDDCGQWEGNQSYPSYVAYLKSKMRRASQRIFLVPPTFVARQPQDSGYLTGVNSSGVPNECSAADGGQTIPAAQIPLLEDFLTKTHALARSETVIVGVFPYTWASYCDGAPRWYESAASSTAPALALAKQKLQEIGRLAVQWPIVVEGPLNQVTGAFTLRGWALDKRGTGTGVAAVHAWGRTATGAATFLGAATLNRPSPTAAGLHGSAYTHAGFELTTSMASDIVQIEIFAYNTYNWQFEVPAAVHKVAFVQNPSHEMWIDLPSQNQTVGASFPVTGWVFGRSASTDPPVPHNGIDAVDVWAYNHGTAQSTYLGPATIYGHRPDVQAAFGTLSPFNGYGLTVNNLPAGTYTITVYARSTLTGQFSISQQRTVIRQ